MSEKISLQSIIESVLEEKGVDPKEQNDQVRLRRALARLMERLGSNIVVLKNDGRIIEFDELEVPTIKVLLSWLYSNEGIIDKFVNTRQRNKVFSSNEVIDFIHSLYDEIAKDDEMDKEEMEHLLTFFKNIFLYSPLRSLETCHKTIDELALNLHDLPCDEQSIYLGKVEHILKKEFALRIAESAREVVRIAQAEDYRYQYFYERDPEIQFYYMNRDKQILAAIQEDDDLRQYVEKKLGRKAEEIFNYASLA